jgi:transcriptional regulator with XRE-family HTH domain
MPTQQQGPVGQRVARNVSERRDGMSLRDLSAALGDVGRPILPSGIIKIENGTRRVDADDLVALALTLGVTPNRLMLGAEHDSEPIRLTPQVETIANGAWRWACGEQVIRPGAHGAPPLRDVLAFMVENRPHAAAGDLSAQLAEHRDALQPVVRAARAALAAGVPVGVLLHAMLIADTIGDELPGGGTDGQD